MPVLSFLFRIYRLFLSPAMELGFGIQCRFKESCSRYTERMIREQGILKGSMKGLRRFVACNPFLEIFRSFGSFRS